MKALKKTRLSSSKEFVPTEDGTGKEEYQLIIYVDAGGLFYAPVPKHLHNSAAHLAKGDGGVSRNHSGRGILYENGAVCSDSKNQVVDDWKTLVWRVEQYLIGMVREKVIWYRTEMNISYRRDNGDWVNRNDVHFAKTNPVVGITYKVCFKVGQKLLDEKNHYVADLKLRNGDGGIVIPYTEERIQFLDKIAEMLHKAAEQLNEFDEVLRQDPLQIDTVMKQGFLLEYRGA